MWSVHIFRHLNTAPKVFLILLLTSCVGFPNIITSAAQSAAREQTRWPRDSRSENVGNAKHFYESSFPYPLTDWDTPDFLLVRENSTWISQFFNKLGNAALQSGKAQSRKLPWHTNWPVSHARLAFHLVVMQRKRSPFTEWATGIVIATIRCFLRDRDRNAQAMAIHRCVRSTTPTNHTASDRNKTILQRQSAGAKALLVGNENGCTKGLVRSRPYLTAHWRHPDCRAAIKKAGDQCAVR